MLAEGRLVLRAERPQAVTIEFPTTASIGSS
jgi:hypothetical protein